MLKRLSFKRVLVAVDGSDVSLRAVDVAARIARNEGGSLTAIHIVVTPQFDCALDDYYDSARRSAKKWMDNVEKAAALHGMTVKTEILVGAFSILDAIVEYAESRSMDLIVTGTRGRTQSANLLVGSVAAGLVEYSKCSVLAVR